VVAKLNPARSISCLEDAALTAAPRLSVSATPTPGAASRELAPVESAAPPATGQHDGVVDLPGFMSLIHAEFANAPNHSIDYRLLAGAELPGWRVRGRWRLPAEAAKAVLAARLGLTRKLPPSDAAA
jgi:hypothetical protein